MRPELSSSIDESVSELRDALSTTEFVYKNCAGASAVDLTSIIGVAFQDGCKALNSCAE